MPIDSLSTISPSAPPSARVRNLDDAPGLTMEPADSTLKAQFLGRFSLLPPPRQPKKHIETPFPVPADSAYDAQYWQLFTPEMRKLVSDHYHTTHAHQGVSGMPIDYELRNFSAHQSKISSITAHAPISSLTVPTPFCEGASFWSCKRVFYKVSCFSGLYKPCSLKYSKASLHICYFLSPPLSSWGIMVLNYSSIGASIMCFSTAKATVLGTTTTSFRYSPQAHCCYPSHSW